MDNEVHSKYMRKQVEFNALTCCADEGLDMGRSNSNAVTATSKVI